MINFIICEDNKFFNKQFCDIIDKVMMKNNLEYHKHIFFDFNDDFSHKINSDISNKIYILDIVMPSADGTDIAGLIRKTDLDSLVIFVTSYYDEYEFELLNGTYMFLKFIDKASNYKELLTDTLEKAIQKKHKNILTLNLKDTLYRFDLTKVSHIVYDNTERKTYINFLFDKKIPCNISIKKIKKELSQEFILTKSCCIVNVSVIDTIDKVNRIIYFTNGKSTDKVSKKGLQELMNYMKGV